LDEEEEQKARSVYYRVSEQCKYQSPQIVKKIGEVTYDTHDPETRLICESGKAIAGYAGETPRQSLKQLYRMKDARYFVRRGGEIEPMDTEAVHTCMDKHAGWWYLTESQKKGLKELDEKIRIARRSEDASRQIEITDKKLYESIVDFMLWAYR